MKNYEMPEIEIQVFVLEDVITTSGTWPDDGSSGGAYGENELPM